MLTQKRTVDTTTIAVSIQDKSLNDLLEKEWLLTNGRGSFTSGSIIGCNTRRYHSLLVGTLHPPANRTTTFANTLETLTSRDHSVSLSNFEFDHTIHPNGYLHLLEFQKDLGVHFSYETPSANLTKSIYLLPGSDIVSLIYDFTAVYEPFSFSVRPFAVMRDFHSLRHANGHLSSVWDETKLCIRDETKTAGQLAFFSESMRFEQNAQWWYRFFYRMERQRGQDCFEDLWSPGEYTSTIDGPRRIVLWAGLFEDDEASDLLLKTDVETLIDANRLKQKEHLQQNGSQDSTDRALVLAADQFIIERDIDNETTPTILAGYPWFLDWGRDTFISLPGLCLATGRFEDAWGVFKNIAKSVSEGIITNRFDDYGNPPHYNSIDASLWFIHAAFQYVHTTGNTVNFTRKLLPAIKWIMDAYRKGTRFGIHADKDKLITGGDAHTQLTWMDAKYNDIAFTPRYGKAVEINALWYSNLCELAHYYKTSSNEESARFYALLAEQVRRSFQELFWDQHQGYLNDCVLPDGKPDTSIRPNQIYAVSLPCSPLMPHQQRQVVEVVERELLTPYGLRSLSPSDPRYKGKYFGSHAQRDEAYHQGTVWGFLIGPFVEAYLKVHGLDPVAKRRCRTFLSKLLDHLHNDACLGSISEIFDGDAPHHPRGAFAQAWSVAEVLRAWQMCRKE
jgi:predicted glycogen debranching enzyme